MKPAIRTILFAQLFLYGGLAVCVLLKPTGLTANDGISYYGIYRETFLPYAIALLGAAYCVARAINQLPESEKTLRLALKVYAPLVVGLTITPYAAGNLIDYAHTLCGAALFFLQLLLSWWLAKRLHYPWWSVMLIGVEVGSGLLSAIYLSPTHGFLFQAQVVFQLAFGTLLVLSLQRLQPSYITD